MKTVSGYIQCGKHSIPYVVEHSVRRRRTIALRLEPLRTGAPHLHITAPPRTSHSTVEKILRQKVTWILRQIDQRHNAPLPAARPQAGGHILYLGQAWGISVTYDACRPLSCTAHDHNLIINLHGREGDNDDNVIAAEITTETTLWLRKQARSLLAERMRHWSDVTGLRPTRLIIGAAESRWGSCDSKNVIRLSWRLVMVSPDLIDYVVLHELCHIPHKNHGADFWNLVATFMPDHKQRRQRLKREGMALA